MKARLLTKEQMLTGGGAPKPDAAKEAGIRACFYKLLWEHPELTRPQAYLLAVMETVGYRGYLVPPELVPEVLARLESNDEAMKVIEGGGK